MIVSNRFRFEEIVIENRLREIEGKLHMYAHTDVWLRLQRPSLDTLADDPRRRHNELMARVQPPSVVKALGRWIPFPLGFLIGVGGMVIWSVLVAQAFLVYFGLL